MAKTATMASAGWKRGVLAGITAAALSSTAGTSSAFAQFQPFPGSGGSVVMTMPQPGAAPAPVPAQPAPPPAKAAAPAPKPKPKPKPVTTASADTGGAKSGSSIVMLVNDEPITAYEVDMRTRFLAMSSGGQEIAKRAQDSFKALATNEGVNARFRAQVEELIKQNQGKKSREEIMKMIEAKKTEFAQ